MVDWLSIFSPSDWHSIWILRGRGRSWYLPKFRFREFFDKRKRWFDVNSCYKLLGYGIWKASVKKILVQMGLVFNWDNIYIRTRLIQLNRSYHVEGQNCSTRSSTIYLVLFSVKMIGMISVYMIWQMLSLGERHHDGYWTNTKSGASSIRTVKCFGAFLAKLLLIFWSPFNQVG